MQRAWFALAVVALVAAAWMARYDVSDGQLVYKLDRWTGQASSCVTC